MQTWNLAAGDPLSLTLAADARLTSTNFADDQIWEINLSGGEPPALGLQTTFGLRAHWMRIFPRFVRGETVRSDPAKFHISPRITSFNPNTAALAFAPFEGLDVQAEYRVAESNIVTGRIKVTNQSILPQSFRLEWVALLNPIDRQGGMVTVPIGPTTSLQGETAYLFLAVFMTGGSQPSDGPYPALSIDMDLYPGSWRQFTWAAAAVRGSAEAALEAARAATARPWEAEQARVDLTNQSQTVQITTGDLEWDAAFALSQKSAFGLLLNNPGSFPKSSFVLSRRPDHGFSLRGDGSDLIHLWSGQTALDTYYFSSLVPGAPEVACDLLTNLISLQDENGWIDWKPGLGGQRTRHMAQPVLATLAVELAPHLSQPGWYEEVFPALLRFFEAWFSPKLDKDEDGFPEWETQMQTGAEDSPIFDRWSSTAQGMQIDYLESPGLAAMLLRECQSLIEIARTLVDTQKANAAYARLSGEPSPQASQTETALERLCLLEEKLRSLLESTWDAKTKLYHYRDFQTHLSLPGELLLDFQGPGRVTSRKRFQQPRRLVIHLKVNEERSYPVLMTLQGFTAEGEVSETLSTRSFSWHGTQARATTQNAYLALKRIEVTGLGEEDQVKIFTADLMQEDCSLFLPLWAGAPGEQQARLLIEDTLLARYMYSFGIPLCPPEGPVQVTLPGLHTSLSSALLPWNQLIGEGLLKYGYRAEAAALLTRLMSAITSCLKTHQDFRQYYDCQTGLAGGERGHLHGLAPVGFFLKTLGIQHLSAREILLDGFNPFPWVVNVQYRKVSITCYPERTEVRFKDDHLVTIESAGTHRIRLT